MNEIMNVLGSLASCFLMILSIYGLRAVQTGGPIQQQNPLVLVLSVFLMFIGVSSLISIWA